jgi:hypothetical protein
LIDPWIVSLRDDGAADRGHRRVIYTGVERVEELPAANSVVRF